MKCYQAGYPRPQFVRDPHSWESINGSWDFSFDNKNEGIDKKWYSSLPKFREINVPFAFECPASGIGDNSRHEIVWYRRLFNINPKKKPGCRVILHFEGSDYNTRIWINGKYAGAHDGGYTRFSFDITPLLKSRNNNITIRVEDTFDISKPRGKQRWMEESFGCWYIQTTGIWKTIWLEYVNPEHIHSVKMTPVFSQRKLEIEAEINAQTEEGMVLEAAISFKDRPVTKTAVPVTGKNVTMNADISTDNNTWSPDHPNLYDITFTLRKKNKTLDQVYSYFGMREIRIEGNLILLNGKPLYMRLIMDQGYWKDSHMTPPDEQALVTDIDNVLAAGYNGVRIHQKIEDEKFFYWADVKGLLVWSEMPAAYEFNDYAVTNFTREWMDAIRQFYNHPSIIVWTSFNESWGIEKIKNDRSQQEFTESIYYLTKSYDKYRPVVCNDGWEHTISDIITLHDYEENGEEFTSRYENHFEEILNNLIYHNLFKSVFADGYAYHGQPVFLSEFGGIAFNNPDDGWGYGNKVNTKEEFIKRFDAITTAVKKIGVFCGYCYTQLTDIQQEVNGIMNADHSFKVDPKILKEINERYVNQA